MREPHTSGSVSHACCRHKMAQNLGHPPRRDEVYITTHTRKNGVPLRQASATITKLEAAVEAHPELKDRTIQEGDVFATVCGVKEPRGRVRVLGLGPTPQEIGTPGLKSYVPTRFQMESLARRRAESEKAALQLRIVEMEKLLEQRTTREMANVETLSQHGSNSRHQVSPRSEELVDEAHHNAQGEDHCGGYGHFDEESESDDENLFDQMQGAAPSLPARNITTTPMNDAAPRYAHDTLVGSDVLLFAMLRTDQPVDKGTVVSTNPKAIVGGQSIGKQFCEVIVNLVIKRDAVLPRPYGNMESMAGAYMMSIAWPYKRLKVVSNRATTSSQGAAGRAGC